MAAHVLAFLWLLTTFSFSTCTITSEQHVYNNCSQPDLQALRSFAATWPDLAEVWPAVGEDCCSWDGVTCTTTPPSAHHNNSTAPLISEIMVYGVEFQQHSDLSHSIASICNLSALTFFEFALSFPLHFHGSPLLVIPDCLGTQLQLLVHFSIGVWGVGDFYSSNYFVTSVPSSFSRLHNLHTLLLWGLNISSESLLPITALPNLKTLDLSYCLFPGPHPFNFSRLPNKLVSFTLTDSSLSQPLFPFTNTPLLESLDLSHNFIGSTLLDFALHSNLPRLTDLRLHENLLAGTVPETLCQLTNLASLYLDDNAFTGDFLSRCGHNLTTLSFLSVQNNQFSGPFPTWIGRQVSLDTVYLSGNNFSGVLPQEWQHLSMLKILDLSGNLITPNISTGLRLPDWIFRLPSLEDLALGSTGLESRDCGCHGRHSLLNQTLQSLDLSQNNLTGANTLECLALHNFSHSSINVNLAHNPLSFFLPHTQLPSSIWSIDLSSCLLEGSLTDKFLELMSGSVGSISLANNNLVGIIPTKLMNLSILSSLDLSHNSFTGFVANQSFSLIQGSIFLSHNALSGDLASYMLAIFKGLDPNYCPHRNLDMDGIASVDLSHNNLTGTIPTSFSTVQYCGMSYFSRVKFDDNNLVGNIPDELGGLPVLQTLTLRNNHLVGTIPTSLLNTTSLQVLDLSYNELDGDLETLISSISQPTSLCVLLLGHNHISGSIPHSLGAIAPSLQVIDLSHNKLTGHIPPNLQLPAFRGVQTDQASKSISTLYEEIQIVVKGVDQKYAYELQVLTSLDVSHNLLVGEIPSQLGEFSGLRYLNLSQNKLQGWIPADLSKLHVLEALDLSNNSLQGKIPSDLSLLTSLAVFNVSFNKALEGAIPAGPQFESNNSFRGDPDLCGYPILQHCPVEEDPSTPSSAEEGGSPEGNPIQEWIKEWVAIPGLCLGSVVGFGVTLWAMHGSSCLFKMGARLMLPIKNLLVTS